MCGIAAIFKLPSGKCPVHALRAMTDAVSHRGPDDSGLETFSANGLRLSAPDPASSHWAVGLGHRRLSILDLSPARVGVPNRTERPLLGAHELMTAAKCLNGIVLYGLLFFFLF